MVLYSTVQTIPLLAFRASERLVSILVIDEGERAIGRRTPRDIWLQRGCNVKGILMKLFNLFFSEQLI